MIADWRAAPIDDKLRTVLAFLEKLTLTPTEVGPDDIAKMRIAGLSDQAIADAAYVCFVFNVVDRLADAFDFKLESPTAITKMGEFLFQHGYATGSVPDTV